MRFSPKAQTFIVAILFTGYAVGTVTHVLHALDVLQLGLVDSARAYGVSPGVNAYWLSLTIIDPLIAFLLVTRRRAGVFLAFVNILVNVVVNSWVRISALPVVTLGSVYDSLGNIYNGLQIALLVFSACTVPLFLPATGTLSTAVRAYTRLFDAIPFVALAAGLAIHLVGLVNVILDYQSLWVTWVHVSMTAVDTALIYALARRLRIGYIVAVAGFGIFALLQGGFAVAILFGVECPFNLSMAVTIAVCCLAIASLLLNRDHYGHTFRPAGVMAEVAEMDTDTRPV